MRRYILIVDPIGKTNLEIRLILKKYNVDIIHVKDVVGVTAKLLEYKDDIKLIFWYIEEEHEAYFEIIEKLKLKNIAKDIPFAIISNRKEKKYIIRALKCGAIDYIIRPFSEYLILKKIGDVVKDFGISNKKEVPFEDIYEEEDEVTFSLHDIISFHIKGTTRANYPLSIYMLKLISSEEENIQQKKELISIIQPIAKKILRETDIIIRYGVESIVIILPYTDKDGAYVVDKKLRAQFSKSVLLNDKGEGIVLSSSYVSFPEDGKNKDGLFSKLIYKLQPTIFFTRKVD